MDIRHDRDVHVHGHRTGRSGDDVACVVRVGDWPYECVAKDQHPGDTVYYCDSHRCWWHEARPVVVVTLTGPADSVRRQQFYAQWWTDNVGAGCDQTGWRGQHFDTDTDAHAARWAARGFRVITRNDETAGDA